MQKDAVVQPVDRRGFLGYAIGAIGAFCSMAVGVPLVGSLVMPTLRQRQAEWVPVGVAAQFPLNTPKNAEVSYVTRDGWVERRESKGVWVVRKGDNDFTVFNARCTHLGCAFSWREEQKQFICPCHNGRWSPEGQVLGGPPPRALDTLQWKVEQGNLLVEYQDFRLGVPDKVFA